MQFMEAGNIHPASFSETQRCSGSLAGGKERATFMVRIQYRQNATWQGQVTWAEKQQTMLFRSALELLKLMDSTVSVDTWFTEDN